MHTLTKQNFPPVAAVMGNGLDGFAKGSANLWVTELVLALAAERKPSTSEPKDMTLTTYSAYQLPKGCWRRDARLDDLISRATLRQMLEKHLSLRQMLEKQQKTALPLPPQLLASQYYNPSHLLHCE